MRLLRGYIRYLRELPPINFLYFPLSEAVSGHGSAEGEGYLPSVSSSGGETEGGLFKTYPFASTGLSRSPDLAESRVICTLIRSL